MSRKVQLRLIYSDRMGEAGENHVIRFPRRARENFRFSNDRVVIGKGLYELSLQVKQAYREDVSRLTRMIKSGKVREEETYYVGFVTRSVQQRVSRKKDPKGPWVTEGISSITVGADPEFGLIGKQGFLVRGNQVLSAAGKFGSDGPSVEVRPDPSRSHLEVVANMQSILQNPPPRVDQFLWKGGATFVDPNRVYWFGGHIHLGRPSQIPANRALPIYTQIAGALDGLLALPMARFDTPEPWHRRNGCKYNYGKAGDIRADYPERDRFEYRVLSGLWLVHPTLAKIAIGTAKCIAETAYGRIADKKFDLEWASNPISKPGMLKTFGIKGFREIRAMINRARPEEVTEDKIDVWERWVRSLDRFDDYKPEITALISLAKEDPSHIVEGVSLDVRKNWQEDKKILPRASKQLRTALEEVEAR
ncbi:MAG: hypothetical protein GF334_03715 [Candidatus Altiarchaeales archaeon]|nr:hypothetical protein [Candidatus Altiarchaeales archaeon]